MWNYPGSGSPAPPSSEAESAIRELVQDFSTHFNTGNFDKCALTFIPEGQIMIPHCEAMQGQRSIERGLHQLADAGYEDLRLETMRVDASGDRATEVGRYSAVVRLGKGRTVSDGGNYLASWRRLGAWRMAVQCFSSSIPRTWQDAQERQLRTLERPEVMPRDVQRPA